MKDDGPRLVPERVREPPRPWTRPRYPNVEVRYSDRSWRPAEVLAWFSPAEPVRSIMSEWQARWLVQLRFPDGTQGWYRFTDAGVIRPRSS